MEQNDDKRVKLRVIEIYLKGPGKDRGYTTRPDKGNIKDQVIKVKFSKGVKQWL